LKLEFIKIPQSKRKYQHTIYFKRETLVRERRYSPHAKKESNMRGESVELGSWFTKPYMYFSSSKKGEGERTCDKSEGIKWSHDVRAFQRT
jgi:hypothetical protein